MSLINLIGSNLSGAPTLSFDELVIHQCFTTGTSLVDQLTQNYTRQAILQAYRVLGSSDLLGDPIGLVENLGSGVAQFVRITKDEVLGDCGTRGEGIKVLGKSVAKAGATTAAKITGSLDRLVGCLTTTSAPVSTGSEEDHEDRRSRYQLAAGTKFAKSFGREIAGIVQKPLAGAREGGVTGLVKGTVQGIMGPGVACLKAVTAATHNIASGVEATMIDRAPFKGRRRNPKKFVQGRLMLQYGENQTPSAITVQLLGAKGLVARQSCDPSLVLYIDQEKKHRTKVLYNTVNPSWKETKLIPLKGGERMIRFAVKDSYGGGALERLLGSVTIPMEQFINDFRPNQTSSPLMHWVDTGIQPSFVDPTVAQAAKAPPEREYVLMGVEPKLENKDTIYVVVSVLEGEGLETSSAMRNLLASPDPYVMVSIGNQRHRTTTRAGANKPQWHEEFTFPVRRPSGPSEIHVKLTAKGKGMLTDENLGTGQVAVPWDGENHTALHRWVQLKRKSAEADGGSIKVRIETMDACDSQDTVIARVGKLRIKAAF